MKLSVTRLYGGVIVGEPAEYVIKRMTFDISADGVSEVEEIEEMIRQLKLLKSEIAGGCPKSTIHQATFSDQTEGDSHN